MPPPPPADRPAVPVAVCIGDAGLAADVSRHVESVLGWQVVEDTPGLPAQLRLVDAMSASPGTLVVVRQPEVEVVRTAMAAGAADVLVWPEDAARLAALTPRQRIRIPGRILPVGGSGGGVGTTTVALLLAAALAWSSAPTWLVTGRSGWQMAGIGAAGGPVQPATAAPGLHLARSLRDLNGRTDEDHHVVLDVGTDHRRRLLVARPDRRFVDACADERAAPRRSAQRVITVGDGGLRPREVRELLGRLPHLHVVHDPRIARAALQGGLPGRFPGRVVADASRWLGCDRSRSRAEGAA